MRQPLPVEYEDLTRQHYQDAAVAANYKAEYSGPIRLRTLPARIVAERERRSIHARIAHIVALDPAGIRKVVDLPCGTGKLATVLSKFNFSVVAADISRQMIDIAAAEYTGLAGFAGFVETDASATSFANEQFDLAVCLRLFHRVPDAVRIAILSELNRISRKHLIVSLGLTNRFQDLRRRARRTITGTSTVPFPVTRRTFTSQLQDAGWHPVSWTPVASFLSSEWIVVGEKRRG